MLNKTVLRTYKTLFPKIIRDKVTILRNAGGLNTIRKNILDFYKKNPEEVNDEIQIVLKYLKSQPLNIFPYEFSQRYLRLKIDVFSDKDLGLNFVFHEGKRMYFKRKWSTNDIIEYYKGLLIEQDVKSPHRYLTDNYRVNEGEIVADVGAAEGIFSLSIIDKVKRLYIFETDIEWIEALLATFKPWRDKVEIVNKFVSANNDKNNISLDSFVNSFNVKFNFIKVDIDGAELSLLKGGENILRNSGKIKIVICTYHKKEDELLFREILESHEFKVDKSDGYMIFYYDSSLSSPYLRRGLLRAIK